MKRQQLQAQQYNVAEALTVIKYKSLVQPTKYDAHHLRLSLHSRVADCRKPRAEEEITSFDPCRPWRERTLSQRRLTSIIITVA